MKIIDSIKLASVKFKMNLKRICHYKKVPRLSRKKLMLLGANKITSGVTEALFGYQVRTPTEVWATDVGRASLVGNMVILLLVVLIPRGF